MAVAPLVAAGLSAGQVFVVVVHGIHVSKVWLRERMGTKIGMSQVSRAVLMEVGVRIRTDLDGTMLRLRRS